MSNDLNLSLLSQHEIDTLVAFLLDKKNSVDSSVLNQKSVDKLIELLRYDKNRRKQEMVSSMPDLEGSLAEAIVIRKDAGQVCEIHCETDESDGYLKMKVQNTESGEEMDIAPAIINSEDDSSWGRCISPVTFCRLASALGVKYSAETYEDVCKRYAECVFGDAEYKIPFLYLPTNTMMLQSLL